MTTHADMLYHLGGVPVASGQDISGTTYFVDGNSGLDSNDGKSWENAFQTFARAVVVSNVDIARGSDRWARRNTIYMAGDRLVEDITALPNKTDVIGVGSCDSFKGACLEGDHVIASGTGTRFYNMGFEPGTADDIFTFSTAGSSGIEFHNCEFRANRGGSVATGAIEVTNCINLKVINCEFRGAFSSEYINIAAGAINGMIIRGNTMVGGADNGIMVTGTGTITGGQRGLIADNYIECADIAIDVNATSVFNVINNIMISDAAIGSGSYVIDLSFAAKNLLTGNDISVGIPSYTTVA